MEKNTQNVDSIDDKPPPYSQLPNYTDLSNRSATFSGYPHAPPYPQEQLYPTAQQCPNTQRCANIPTASNAKYCQVPQVRTRIVAIGPDPVAITCPSCHAEIRTEIQHAPSANTHLIAFIALLFCWPLACVPYCVDSCKNANHYCPNCRAFIGAYQS